MIAFQLADSRPGSCGWGQSHERALGSTEMISPVLEKQTMMRNLAQSGWTLKAGSNLISVLRHDQTHLLANHQ